MRVSAVAEVEMAAVAPSESFTLARHGLFSQIWDGGKREDGSDLPGFKLGRLNWNISQSNHLSVAIYPTITSDAIDLLSCLLSITLPSTSSAQLHHLCHYLSLVHFQSLSLSILSVSIFLCLLTIHKLSFFTEKTFHFALFLWWLI